MSRNTPSAVKHATQTKHDQKNAAERAAWNRPDWCGALGIGVSSYYVLAVRPRSIKLGKRLLIVESPAAYAERIAKMQAAA